MKKLIQVLIVCGLVVFMGGTASGDSLQDILSEVGDNDYKKALDLLEPLADEGNLDAIEYLGSMYQFGWHGIEKDIDFSNALFAILFKLSKPLADQGDPKAQFLTGNAYYFGKGGVTRNKKEALKLYLLAAEQGHKRATLRAGQTLFGNSRGPGPDLDKAINLLLPFAKKGDFPAIMLLSSVYSANGNTEEAKKWKQLEDEMLKESEAEGAAKSESGKVVVRITSAVPSYSLESENNDFEELLGYNLSVGCKYTVEIENKTPHKVKLEGLVLETNHPEIPRGIYGSAIIVSKEVFDPGQKSIPFTLYGNKLEKRFELLPKVPSDEKKNKMIEKYGCDAQAGTLYLDAHPMHPIIATFAKSTGIKDPSNEYIIGHSYGDYPLKKYVGGMSR